ncbi:hypothetical protein APHAL10511_001329 [Amanita phalloides]|nr:hypothetical protein APHAL10511_001329 [Amanita phalloides]
MPSVRKRKTPVTDHRVARHTSPSSKSTRATIRQYHVLLKRRAYLLTKQSDAIAQQVLAEVDQKLEELGGLEAYQHMSVVGQDGTRGGGSERVFIDWLKDLGIAARLAGQKLGLLEVGALKPDNYRTCSSWLDCTPIDLRSQHPSIREQDFLLLDENENHEYWDLISLSLVLNFVPKPNDRGRMLRLAHHVLKPGGYLFLVLPLPCVLNSRYLDLEHMKRIMRAVGFALQKERWRKEGKMGYWLFQKDPAPRMSDEVLRRRFVLRQGNRNNFCILL